MIVNSGVETGKKLSRSTLAFKSQNRFKFCDLFQITIPLHEQEILVESVVKIVDAN